MLFPIVVYQCSRYPTRQMERVPIQREIDRQRGGERREGERGGREKEREILGVSVSP